MHDDAQPVTGQRCETHGTPMVGGRACPLCMSTQIVEADEDPGYYEAATAEARAAGLPDRIEAERILWDRHAQTMAIADACGAVAKDPSLTPKEQAAFVALQLKAIDTAGKDARHAATMILWRERCADAEKADRLYRDQQRKVGRARA